MAKLATEATPSKSSGLVIGHFQQLGSVETYSKESGVSVFQTIENEILNLVAGGALGSGDTLPSVREFSEVLNVNPNTIAKAYRDLQVMGVVIASRGVSVSISKSVPKAIIDRHVAAVLRRAELAVAALKSTSHFEVRYEAKVKTKK